jgi:GNAT superfamily N-acetyltransferase
MKGIFMEIIEGNIVFTDEKNRIMIDEVVNLLRQTHWAKNRPKEVIEETIKNSFCIAVYHCGMQIGFARIITDFAVYSLILDVIIDEKYRGKGLGKKLVEFITNHPRLKNTSLVLWTKNAEKLYKKYGFKEEECYRFLFKRP